MKDMKERKKVGLALGAGAARGLAHIGVLQVFEERNIPVDVISGCSMGAVIGAIYCCGSDMDMCAKFAAEMNEKIYLDVVIPRKGFVAGTKAQSLIRTLTKGMTFEQTKIPLAVIACDVENAKVKTFTSGSIHEAVRASISIPAVFVPYTINGITYVDGGVLERVPIQAVKDLGADIVIAVDVGYIGTKNDPPKNILDVINQVMDIMQWEIAKNSVDTADILLTPDVRDINPNSAAQAKECIELGRKCALEAADRIIQYLEENGAM